MCSLPNCSKVHGLELPVILISFARLFVPKYTQQLNLVCMCVLFTVAMDLNLVDRHAHLGIVLRFCRAVDLQRLRQTAARWRVCCDDQLPMGICAWREVVTYGIIESMRQQYIVEKQDKLLTMRIKALIQIAPQESPSCSLSPDRSRSPREYSNLTWLHTHRLCCSVCGSRTCASKWRCIVHALLPTRRTFYVCASCLLDTDESSFPRVELVICLGQGAWRSVRTQGLRMRASTRQEAQADSLL